MENLDRYAVELEPRRLVVWGALPLSAWVGVEVQAQERGFRVCDPVQARVLGATLVLAREEDVAGLRADLGVVEVERAVEQLRDRRRAHLVRALDALGGFPGRPLGALEGAGDPPPVERHPAGGPAAAVTRPSRGEALSDEGGKARDIGGGTRSMSDEGWLAYAVEALRSRSPHWMTPAGMVEALELMYPRREFSAFAASSMGQALRNQIAQRLYAVPGLQARRRTEKSWEYRLLTGTPDDDEEGAEEGKA